MYELSKEKIHVLLNKNKNTYNLSKIENNFTYVEE